MGKIKKILIFFLFIFFILPINVYGQFENPIPGVNCGIPGAGEGNDKCCFIRYGQLPPPPNWSKEIDIFGAIEKYKSFQESLKKISSLAQKACLLGEPSTSDIADPNCKCVLSLTPTPIYEIKILCRKYLSNDEKKRCENCAAAGSFWSGIGCVPLTVQSFINDYLLRIGIGLGGTLALFCIIYAAFQIQSSAGNAEKIKKSQELLTSCIMGLMLIIFSVFILRLIGVDILKIPGFGK